jgi:hypothetical protein
MMEWYAIMATMIHRTTFALDEVTTTRIESLASLWQVSRAEVIRRSVAMADAPTTTPHPLALLEEIHRTGQGLKQEEATAYLDEVRADRKRWRSK